MITLRYNIVRITNVESVQKIFQSICQSLFRLKIKIRYLKIANLIRYFLFVKFIN